MRGCAFGDEKNALKMHQMYTENGAKIFKTQKLNAGTQRSRDAKVLWNFGNW